MRFGGATQEVTIAATREFGVRRAVKRTAPDDVWSRLMAAAQDGDRKAYERLLREAAPYIRAVVRRVHAAPDRVEEVVQDVLLAVHRVRHTYDPARPFRPWLASIVRRRAIDALRRHSRTDAHEIADDTVYETFIDPTANTFGDDLARDASVRSAVARLPAKQREAITLLKLNEMSLKEAATISGQSEVALKVATHRAIKRLKALLQGN